MSDGDSRYGTRSEVHRMEGLRRVMPGGHSLLDVGARDGFIASVFAPRFRFVAAADIAPRPRGTPGIHWVRADARRLPFPGESFDVVLCTEVLEHVPEFRAVCAEIARVVRRAVVVGVPYRQDIRIGRATCARCGFIQPPWGHVNSFDDETLRGLFPGFHLVKTDFAGRSKAATCALAARLMDWGGNPWGAYDPGETCTSCGCQLRPPPRPLWRKIFSGVAARMNRLQTRAVSEKPAWVHLLFQRDQVPPRCASAPPAPFAVAAA